MKNTITLKDQEFDSSRITTPKISIRNFKGKVKCDFCGLTANYDGKTILGTWAYMCKRCFINEGTGLGVGRGQEINYL